MDVLLEALLDSVKAFILLLAIYIGLSFLETKLANKITKESKLSPFFGSLFGLVPQCGFSVIAADLYLKQHITMGTVVAVFISCSDEALPILLSKPEKIGAILPLLLIKFLLGFMVGYLIDFVFHKSKLVVEHHHDECTHEDEIHVGCCKHDIEDGEQVSKIKKYLVHPLLHSLKIFAYILVINVIFSVLIYYVGEDKIHSFLMQNAYFTPLYSVLIGLIPNCASSVILTNLFVTNQITFGSCIAGLICNAGLGFVYLFARKNNWKQNILILLIVSLTGLISGYVLNLIFGFVI